MQISFVTECKSLQMDSMKSREDILLWNEPFFNFNISTNDRGNFLNNISVN